MVQKDRNAAKRWSMFSEISSVEDIAGSDRFFLAGGSYLCVCKRLNFFV